MVHTIQRMADRLVTRLVPKISASAGDYEYACTPSYCSSPYGQYVHQYRRRFCYVGYCYAWENWGCC
jgi:hypothetical protein